MAKITYIGYLSQRTGYRHKNFNLSGPTAINNLIELHIDREDVIVMVDNKIGNFDTIINDCSSVIIMPAMSGG
jgi:molybdopterin converting factor small subunit